MCTPTSVRPSLASGFSSCWPGRFESLLLITDCTFLQSKAKQRKIQESTSAFACCAGTAPHARVNSPRKPAALWISWQSASPPHSPSAPLNLQRYTCPDSIKHAQPAAAMSEVTSPPALRMVLLLMQPCRLLATVFWQHGFDTSCRQTGMQQAQPPGAHPGQISQPALCLAVHSSQPPHRSLQPRGQQRYQGSLPALCGALGPSDGQV